MPADITEGGLPYLGVYPYAPLLYVDYLQPLLDAQYGKGKARACTEMPTKRPQWVVQISTAPASQHESMVLAWRRLIFTCSVTPQPDDELLAAWLCERVRTWVKRSRYQQRRAGPPPIAVRVNVIGEPSRFDRPDEPAKRFQTTIDVLLRETYCRT